MPWICRHSGTAGVKVQEGGTCTSDNFKSQSFICIRPEVKLIDRLLVTYSNRRAPSRLPSPRAPIDFSLQLRDKIEIRAAAGSLSDFLGWKTRRAKEWEEAGSTGYCEVIACPSL